MWIRIVLPLLGVSCLWLTLPAEAQPPANPAPASVAQLAGSRPDLSARNGPGGKTRADSPVSPSGAADQSPDRQTAR